MAMFNVHSKADASKLSPTHDIYSLCNVCACHAVNKCNLLTYLYRCSRAKMKLIETKTAEQSKSEKMVKESTKSVRRCMVGKSLYGGTDCGTEKLLSGNERRRVFRAIKCTGTHNPIQLTTINRKYAAEKKTQKQLTQRQTDPLAEFTVNWCQ